MPVCLGLIYFCYIMPFTLKKFKKKSHNATASWDRDGMSSDFVQISVIIIAEKSIFKIFLSWKFIF
jgi:hypothetical protein